MEKIKVVEIFSSIEGEGSLIGYPVSFIRLEGCNLRCTWCDTKYSYDTQNYKSLPLSDIMLILKNFGNKKVCLTGGEPLFNEGFEALFQEILKEKYFLIIETNGTTFKEVIQENWDKYSKYIHIVCSPKPFSNFYIDEKLIHYIKELKLVVDDILKIEDVIYVINKFKNLPILTFQPESNRKDMFAKAREFQKQLLIKYNLEFRIIPQVHKIFNLQ